MRTPNPLQSIQTPDLMQERLDRLKAEFPDLFTNEGKLNSAELQRLTQEEGRERFDFSWWGKAAAKRKAFTPTTAALRYDEARSVNPELANGNAIIEGENLEVLKLLLSAYRGQVKCIYIDPPYNTGNDFVYKDNFAEDRSAYWEQTGVTQNGVKLSTNTRADGRFHSNWLNMIYPRLLVARQLLRDDGVIFVSIDDNEVTHLRKVMDEVFGAENFYCTFVWKRRSGAMDSVDNVSTDHEYVIAYGRSKTQLAGVMRTFEGYANPDDDLRGDWKADNLSAGKAGGDVYYAIRDPKSGNEFLPPEGRFWPYSRKTMAQKIAEARVIFPASATGRPMLKRFKEEAKFEKVPVSTWMVSREDDRVMNTLVAPVNTQGTRELQDLLGGKVFSHPKSSRLISSLISQCANGHLDIVLDFFAGSGSTASAVLALNREDVGNRRFIGVQIPEKTEPSSEAYKVGFKKISDITIERVKRVIQGYGDAPQPISAGFKVYTLEKSAFPRADFAPEPDASPEENFKALKAFIADKEASLFNTLNAQAVCDEVLLKCGFQLDAQLTPIIEVQTNALYWAKAGAQDPQAPAREAIVCFDSHLHTDTLEWLRQQRGQSVIVLEAALDTTAKWNLHHQLGDGLMVF